jgi:hypothetical protein
MPGKRYSTEQIVAKLREVRAAYVSPAQPGRLTAAQAAQRDQPPQREQPGAGGEREERAAARSAHRLGGTGADR